MQAAVTKSCVDEPTRLSVLQQVPQNECGLYPPGKVFGSVPALLLRETVLKASRFVFR